MVVYQGNFGGLAVITEQLQVNIGEPRGCAMPDSTCEMWTKGRQPLHPLERQAPQRQQLTRLGVGAKQCDVLAHRILDLVIVR